LFNAIFSYFEAPGKEDGAVPSATRPLGPTLDTKFLATVREVICTSGYVTAPNRRGLRRLSAALIPLEATHFALAGRMHPEIHRFVSQLQTETYTLHANMCKAYMYLLLPDTDQHFYRYGQHFQGR
jgi:hypothetical protein